MFRSVFVVILIFGLQKKGKEYPCLEPPTKAEPDDKVHAPPLSPHTDDLGLELEDEPAPRRSKQEHPHRAIQLKPEGREAIRSEPKVMVKMEGREKVDHREKIEHREKAKSKPDPPAPRISAKERLGGIVPPKANTSREKV